MARSKNFRASTTRRQLLRGIGGAALALPFFELLAGNRSRAQSGLAERIIFFYFPDGVAGPSQSGASSLWHATPGPTLPTQLEPLNAFKQECAFFSGLSMGGTDSGSHPGGAKKLLTAVDGGQGVSIDQVLAHSVGADAPWKHLLLGAQANADNASGDKHISYPSAGVSLPPQDNPITGFELVFGKAPGTTSGGNGPSTGPVAAVDPIEVSVIDGVLDDMHRLRSQLGTVEQAKLDVHLESLREVEKRIKGETAAPVTASCDDPNIDVTNINESALYAPESFPAILRAQIDLMVQAMACGQTRVGTIQASHHTSELIMSRFAGTEMYDPNFDMRSHQASHYGPEHDYNKKEFASFVQQRRYWVGEFTYLLEQLAARPEGDGSMLDNSIVVLCTEVCDGNTHLHDNMPFVVAGRGGGRINPGVYDVGYRRHGDLFTSLGQAMGHGMGSFGQGSQGPIPGLLSS